MTIYGYITTTIGWICVIIGICVYIYRYPRIDFIYSKQAFWVLECFTLFFSSILFYFLQIEKCYDILFLFFSDFGSIAILLWSQNLIQYDETGFYVFTFLWFKKRYEYQDIVSIERKTQTYQSPHRKEHITILRMEKGKITVNEEDENFGNFMIAIKKVYKNFYTLPNIKI